MKILLVAFLLLSSPAYASNWTHADSVRELTFISFTVVDWGQTHEIVDNYYSNPYHETNPFLGRHPSKSQIDDYFAAMVLSHYLIARLLPSSARKAFQYVTIGMELSTVGRNYSVGLTVPL